MNNNQQFQLAKRQQAKKNESNGFNLDSLHDQSIEALFASYDQVQVRNGQENLLLQRSTVDNTVAPQANINAQGNLQVLPDVGGKAIAAQQRANAAINAQKNAVPTWEKYAIPVGVGVAGLVAIVLAIRHG